MNNKNQSQFKATIMNDIRLIDNVIKIMNSRIAKDRKEKITKRINYYTQFILWCENLKGNITEIATNGNKKEISKEEFNDLNLSPEQIETIVLMRANNPFYKRVLAEYAKKKVDDLLDLLEEKLIDNSLSLDRKEEDEDDIIIYFDVDDQQISFKKIRKNEEQIKEFVKLKAKQEKLKKPISDKDLHNNIEDYIDDYIRMIVASGRDLEVKKVPEEIFENINELSEKIQFLKNTGEISAEESTYYHGILYHLAEYYVGVSHGEQIPIEEGLRSVKIDKDLFRINQLIAEAVYEMNKQSEATDSMDKPKSYIR